MEDDSEYDSETEFDDRVKAGSRILSPVLAMRNLDGIAIRPIFKSRDVAKLALSTDLAFGARKMLINNDSNQYDGIPCERGFGDDDTPLTPIAQALDGSLRSLLNQKQDELLSAAKSGNIESVLHILENTKHNQISTKKKKMQWDALTHSAFGDHRLITKRLVDSGVSLTYEDFRGWIALMWGCHQNHLKIVELLIARGAPVNHANKYGTTALMWACQQGNLACVRELIRANASVRIAAKDGCTALTLACRSG